MRPWIAGPKTGIIGVLRCSLFGLAILCGTAGMANADPQPAEIGVLVLAHGGTAEWNRLVEQAVAQAKLTQPTAVAFGMGMHPSEVQEIQRGVRKLEERGVSRIVVVPLLISSASEMMRQFQFLLGLRPDGPWAANVKPVDHHAAFVLTPPLDDDPIVSGILLDRALELSQTPSAEAVVLIAHGPVSDEDNAQWLAVMDRLAGRLQRQGHFRAVVPVTMRDDAPKAAQDRATEEMRRVVLEQSRQGRTLVVPLLLATGGIEVKIPLRLKGLTYVYRGRTLLPHPKLAEWIVARVRAEVGAPSADRRDTTSKSADARGMSVAAPGGLC